jgi:hypothetical protein
MRSDSCTPRFSLPHGLSRLRFFFRVFFIAAFLIVLAVWLDYWLRGEMGIAHKFNELLGGRWSTSAFIGGGGGISLTCGISRRISWKKFLLTIILAVLPVPLLAFLGVIQLEAFLGIPK